MIHLRDLSEQLQCSHPIVEKAVTLETGFNFREYKNIKILERCLDLWSQGNCVKYIALELGYKWPDNFSRFFKNITGFSLTEVNRTTLEPPGL